MLVRSKNNKLIEINRTDFTTDKSYYEYILSII